MDADNHERVTALFVAAAQLDGDERESYLRDQCTGDDTLREEVRALLRYDTQDSIVDGTIDDSWVPARSSPQAPHPARVGPYEIVELLGRGGMGAVYSARQHDPERLVALKIVGPTLLRPEPGRRLRFEAGVLARLQHPGIAQVYDVGTSEDAGSSVSYFAMELVDGRTITEHASSRGLSVRERVSLMASVCDAVQHAHQRGVIHRDLKPANILVAHEGHPKVLDFGVARLTDSDVRVTTEGTDAGRLLGTIAYMSPEQLDGDPLRIDTRSDVYALGAILHELLCGKPPVDLTGLRLGEAVHAARTAPRTMLRQIEPGTPRDLDTIVRKALSENLDRRYASASELGADLRRVLAHEPIQARPATAVYRLGRFIRRNPGLCIAGAVASVLLMVAIGAVLYGYTQSTRRAQTLEAANAEITQEANRAVAVGEFLRRMLVSADPLGETGSGRADMTILEMLDHESGQVAEVYADLPESEASIRSTIGSVYLSLGFPDKAEPHLRRSVELHERVWGPKSADSERAVRDLAVLLAQAGRDDEAVSMFSDVLTRQMESDRGETIDHAITAVRYAVVLLNRREYAEAERWLRRAIPIIEQPGTGRGDLLPAATNNLARAMSGQGELEDAEELYRSAQLGFRDLYGPEHPTVAIAEGNIAALRYARGDLEGAVRAYRNVIAALAPSMGERHPRLAVTRFNLSYALYDQGDLEGALREIRLSYQSYHDAFGEAHPETLSALMTTADVLADLNRHAEAAEAYSEISRHWLARDPRSARAQRARFLEGRSHLALGDVGRGDALMTDACAKHLEYAGTQSPTTQMLLRLLVERRLDQGRPDEARDHAEHLDSDRDANRPVLDRLKTAG